jgi:hypothetical protein
MTRKRPPGPRSQEEALHRLWTGSVANDLAGFMAHRLSSSPDRRKVRCPQGCALLVAWPAETDSVIHAIRSLYPNMDDTDTARLFRGAARLWVAWGYQLVKPNGRELPRRSRVAVWLNWPTDEASGAGRRLSPSCRHGNAVLRGRVLAKWLDQGRTSNDLKLDALLLGTAADTIGKWEPRAV